MKKDTHITNIKYKEYDETRFYPITYPGVKRGLYEINVFGTIKSTANNMQRRIFLTPHRDKRGYLRVTLRADESYIDIHKNGYIHVFIQRLVAWEFVLQPENYMGLEVNHSDTIITNNYYKNLEWCTREKNLEHKMKYGNVAKGENHGWATHKEYVVKEIILLMKYGLTAPEIALIIIEKYPNLYNNLDKRDYDRIRGLVSKINRGVSWKWLYDKLMN